MPTQGKLTALLLLAVLSSASIQADITDQWIAQQAARAPTITAPYQADVAQLAATAKKNAQAPDIQATIHSLKSRALSSGSVEPLVASDTPGQLIIFVSSSMPKTSLQQWMSQAQKIGAPLVLRGMIANSVPATQAWVRTLIGDNPQGGVQIDPPLFEHFGITQVPAVVVVAPCLSPDCTSDFDRVSGNVSLSQALNTLADKGDANPQLAKQQLAILRGSHG